MESDWTMGEYYYLACKDCKEMIFLGKLRESFDNENEIRDFMQDHILHELALTGDSFNVDHEIIVFETESLWNTKYKIYESPKTKPGGETPG